MVKVMVPYKENVSSTVSKPPEGDDNSSVVLRSTENVGVECQSAVFSGAHFSGPTTINVYRSTRNDCDIVGIKYFFVVW